MDGPEAAVALVNTWLAASIPAQLDAIAVDLALGARGPNNLPNPSLIAPRDVGKLTVDQFPALMVIVLDTVAVDRVDADLDDLLDDLLDDPVTIPASTGVGYRVTYVLRVLNFARGASFEATQANRLRYALALRMALVGRPGLGAAGKAYVDEASWRESYSDLEQRDARRTIGASYAEFRLTVAEDLLTAAPNYVDTLEVVATMLTAAGETP